MSEQINKVLASTAQSFSTSEQKQARDNIGAMAASASSLYYSTSNPSAFISAVNHDSNLSGSGTVGVPLGLNTSITLAKNGESATLAYDHLTLANSDNDPIISAANGDIYMSAHAGNASSPYTANYGVQGMSIYGSDPYNHITATATLRYSGGTFVEGDDSTKIKATGLTLHTTADGDQLVDASSVVRWNSYSSFSSFTGCSANNGITGNGTSGSPLGLSSTVMFSTSTSATKVGPAAVTAYNHLSTSILGPGYVNTESVLDRGTATLSQSALRFFDSAGNTATCDASSIDRWNSYSAATQVVSRSYPYTDAVNYTSLTVYNPYQTYGASVQDPSSNNIGYFVPKYMAPADLGKVLTVVSDDGYKCEWKDPTGGVPEINPMGQTTVYLSDSPEILTMEADVAYWLETTAGGSFVVYLDTLSTRTIHNKIYLVGTQANCVTMTIVYEDEAGQVQQLNFVYGDTQTDTVYALDVYSRKVTISNGNMSFDTVMCRVYDYPCQTRDYFSSDNNNIGLVENYVEPL